NSDSEHDRLGYVPRMRIGIVLAFCVGCAADDPVSSTTVDYHRDIQPIWDHWCTRCHNFHTPHLNDRESAHDLAGLSWEKCDVTAKAPFIVPGDPAGSYLMFRLTGENQKSYAFACSRPMPADTNGADTPLMQLDPAAVETIRTW